jgi:hypothetical protein
MEIDIELFELRFAERVIEKTPNNSLWRSDDTVNGRIADLQKRITHGAIETAYSHEHDFQG